MKRRFRLTIKLTMLLVSIVLLCLASVAFTAQASATYAVRFELEYGTVIGTVPGESGVPEMQVTVGSSYGALPTHADIYRTGYNFDGWFTQPLTGGVEVRTADTVNLSVVDHDSAHIYLYARWSLRTGFRVNFVYNGGTGGAPFIDTIAGGTVTLPQPARANFTFDGWYSEPGFINKVTSGTSLSVTSDITLHANWIAKPTPQATDFSHNVTVTPARVYTGSAQGVTVTANNASGMGTFRVFYEGIGTAYPRSELAPTNAGRYLVTLDIDEGTVFSSRTELSLGDYEISRKDITTADLWFTPLSVAYTGIAQSVSTPVAAPGLAGMSPAVNVRYRLIENGQGVPVSGTPTASPPIDAGKYEVIVDIETPGANFNAGMDIVAGVFEITRIAPVLSNFSFPIPTNHVYNGQSQGFTVTPIADGTGGATVLYNNLSVAPTNAGTYQITIEVAGGNNYTAAVLTGAGSYTIARRLLTAADLTLNGAAFTIPSHSYTGSELGIGTIGVLSPMTLSPSTVTVLYDGFPALPIAARTYTVSITITPGINYELSVLDGLEYTVERALLVPAAPTVTATSVYENTLSNWALSTNPAGVWSWVDGNIIPTVVNPGYWARFTLTDNNYIIAPPGYVDALVSVTVAPRMITPSTPVVTTGPQVYESALSTWEFEPHRRTTVSGAVITVGTWSWDDGDRWAAVGNTGYAATYRLTDDVNYQIAGSDLATVSVVVYQRTGLAVGSPVVPDLSRLHNILTIAPEAPPSNGQVIEYSIRGGIWDDWQPWQTGLSFTNLLGNTNYQVRSRSQENNNYTAGPISSALSLNTRRNPLEGTVVINNLSPRIDDVLEGSLIGGNNTGVLEFIWRWSTGELRGSGTGYTVTLADAGRVLVLEITSTVEGTDPVTAGMAVIPSTPAETQAVRLKAPPAAPAAPTLNTKTDTSVLLNANIFYEYTNDNGATWQSVPLFEGLTTDQPYFFRWRIAATADTEASEWSPALTVTPSLGVTLDGTAGISNMSPRISDTLTASFTPLTAGLSYEWTVEGAGVQSTSPSYLVRVEDLGKTITLRVFTAAGQVFSAPTAAVEKQPNTSTPPAPTRSSKGPDNITLLVVPGNRYGISTDNGATIAWQSGNQFFGLSLTGAYLFYQQVSETPTTQASAVSPALYITMGVNGLDGSAVISTPDPRIGDTLTAVYSGPFIAMDLPFSYEWFVGGISVGTGAAYTVAVSDFGKTITAELRAAGYTGRILTPATGLVDKASAPLAPAAPVLDTAGIDSIKLVHTDGYEYSHDGINWQPDPEFRGLDNQEVYTFYQRIAGTDAAYTSASSIGAVLKFMQLKPIAPVIASRTNDSVTLETVPSCEYSSNGTDWQDSPVFGITLNTPYTFYQRVKETAGRSASERSDGLSITFKAEVLPPPAPGLYGDIEPDRVTLLDIGGVEFRKDGGAWQDSSEFLGLTPDTQYSFEQRFKETPTDEASPVSPALTVRTIKFSNTTTPTAPTQAGTATATDVTLALIHPDEAGITFDYGYSVDGGAVVWQLGTSGRFFTNLTPNTSYTFYRRIAETATHYASAVSPGLEIRTQRAGLTGTLTISNLHPEVGDILYGSFAGNNLGVLSFEWYVEGSDIRLARGSSYLVTAADLDRIIRLEVRSATANEDGVVTVTTITPVAPATPPVTLPTGLLTINSVDPRIGDILLAEYTGAETIDGWEWNGVSGSDSYIVTAADLGQAITVTVYLDNGDELTVTTNRVDKAAAAKPTAPTVIIGSITHNSITLQHDGDEYEYSIDGNLNWQRSPVFIELAANREFSFYRRVMTDTSVSVSSDESATVRTALNPAPAPPPAPTLDGPPTHERVLLVSISQHEYSKDGVNWQTSSEFSGLEPSTQYTFYQRVRQIGDTLASAASPGVTVTTDRRPAALPPALRPAERTVENLRIILELIDGAEYRIDGVTDWQGNTFDGLTPDTEYTFSIRLKETDISYASEAATVTIKTLKNPGLLLPPGSSTTTEEGSVTHNSATVTPITPPAFGVVVEYAVSTSNTAPTGGWQTSTEFSNLSDGQKYYVFARTAETVDLEAGEPMLIGGFTTEEAGDPLIFAGVFTLTAAGLFGVSFLTVALRKKQKPKLSDNPVEDL